MPDNNNPNTVEYWELAKQFAAAGGEGVAKEYATLAGISIEELFALEPRMILERYQTRDDDPFP